MIKGIDVSKHNGEIDFYKVLQAGYEFVYLKVSQGVGYLDPKFHDNFERARRAGLKIGFYHFASLNDQDEVKDATEEAKFFLKSISGLHFDLLPMLDVETNEVSLTKSEVEMWIRTFHEYLEGKCILYSSAGFLNSYLNAEHRLGNIPLWLSGYPLDRNNASVNESIGVTLKTPKPPIGWNDWMIWQWTGKGSVPGINGSADLNLAKTLPLV